jgi:hypothetical protein
VASSSCDMIYTICFTYATGINTFPKAKVPLGGTEHRAAPRGAGRHAVYDADWFRDTLAARKIEACIPSKSNRKIHIPPTPISIDNATKLRSCSDG